MGVEHSHGSQKLCYINALQEEECFRNDYETHNVFEMGFDLVRRDTHEPLVHEQDPAHPADRYHSYTEGHGHAS